MSRKYKMKGYQQDDGQPRPRQRSGNNGHSARGRVETRYMRTIRCNECSATVQFIDEIKTADTCHNCSADLHTCRNCKFFDPGAPNECMKPVERRVDGKNSRNTCTLFGPKVLIEKAVENRRETAPAESARKAFDDLFKS